MVQTIFPYHKKASTPPYSFEDKDIVYRNIFFDYHGLAYRMDFLLKEHGYRMPAVINSTSNPVT